MSEGLYSMEAKDYDKTLDLTKIKPYGDTMNDGKTQLSFTLPVPAGDEAIEAAKQLMKKMGFENPLVVYSKELTKGFTFSTAMAVVPTQSTIRPSMCPKWSRPQWTCTSATSISVSTSVAR